MDVPGTLRYLGGAARRAELIAAGVAPAAVDTALRRRAAWRPTRGVLAVADADATIIAAATYGGPLTCATALERWRLPVLDAVDGIHLALPPTGTFRRLRSEIGAASSSIGPQVPTRGEGSRRRARCR